MPCGFMFVDAVKTLSVALLLLVFGGSVQTRVPLGFNYITRIFQWNGVAHVLLKVAFGLT